MSSVSKDFINLNLILQNQQLYDLGAVPVFPAKVEYSLNENILNKASDYYLIIESFNCSLANVPVWIPDIQPNIPPYNNTNINQTLYSFTMEYNGTFSSQTFLVFESQNPNQYVRPITVQQPTQDRYTNYYNIYTYTAIAEMLNETLTTCFNDLATATILPTTDVPYFYYNQTTQKFVLVANLNFYDSSSVTPIRIYCNYYLFELIYSIPNNYLGDQNNVVPAVGRDFEIYISDQGNNIVDYPGIPNPAGDYYEISQNNSTIYSFFPLKSIYVATNNIPVNPEIAQQKPVEFFVAPNKVNKLNVLLDIAPIILGNTIQNRNFVQFRPNNIFPIELISDRQLDQLDMSIYWRDRFGNPFLLYLNNNQPANVYVQFVKKSVYKS